MTAFDDWVLNTVLNLSESENEYWRSLQGKGALTYRETSRETRMDACQGGVLGVFATVDNSDYLASMPLFMIAPTNLTFLH